MNYKNIALTAVLLTIVVMMFLTEVWSSMADKTLSDRIRTLEFYHETPKQLDVTYSGVNFYWLRTDDGVDGTIYYCFDCAIGSPCKPDGNGAIAVRSAGEWVCPVVWKTEE